MELTGNLKHVTCYLRHKGHIVCNRISYHQNRGHKVNYDKYCGDKGHSDPL